MPEITKTPLKAKKLMVQHREKFHNSTEPGTDTTQPTAPGKAVTER